MATKNKQTDLDKTKRKNERIRILSNEQKQKLTKIEGVTTYDTLEITSVYFSGKYFEHLNEITESLDSLDMTYKLDFIEYEAPPYDRFIFHANREIESQRYSIFKNIERELLFEDHEENFSFLIENKELIYEIETELEIIFITLNECETRTIPEELYLKYYPFLKSDY